MSAKFGNRALAMILTPVLFLVVAGPLPPADAGAATTPVLPAPSHLRVLSSTQRMVTLHWIESAQVRGFSNFKYIIHARGSRNLTRTCSSSARVSINCTIDGFAPGQLYRVDVVARAVTSSGVVVQSRPSNTIAVRTKPAGQTQPSAKLTAAVWYQCDAPTGGVIQFSYSDGRTTQVFVNGQGYGGDYPPTFVTTGLPGGTQYGYYWIRYDNLGNPIPGNGLALYVQNYYGCALAP